MSRFWLRLDNAALIFPAVRRPGWNNVFRLSVTLQEDIDQAVLQQAVNDLLPRFPSFFVRLRIGMFWYYLEEVTEPPAVLQDYAYPLTHMFAKELHTCCLRILYHKNRIAVEFFHALSDGSGGMVFLKSLAAQYLRLKYGALIPPGHGILSPDDAPRPEELEDSFQRHTGKFSMSRKEANAYQLSGTQELGGFLHLTTGVLETDALLDAAHRFRCTATAFLAAVMTQSILAMQEEEHGRKKPVKITIPVNLRKLFGSETLRNFALTVNLGVDPRLGDYTLQELCTSIGHQLAVEVTPQLMASRIAANVLPQQHALMKIVPLGLKNLALRAVYHAVGERKGCLNISNLGNISLPPEMAAYVRRVEFIIGVQATYPNNCSVASCGGKTYVNMIRNIRESELERQFFSRLVELGIPVKIESNER